MLDDRVTPPIETAEGLRQGSCLSPILFTIFIDSVVTEWRRLGLGVRLGGRSGSGGDDDGAPVRTIGGLLFADDVVLVAESAAELQRAMDVMTDHARRWRYKFNHSKCAVVIAGRRNASGITWMLSGKEVEEKTEYKYLGVQLQNTGRRTSWGTARTKAARGAMAGLWWGGSCHPRRTATAHG